MIQSFIDKVILQVKTWVNFNVDVLFLIGFNLNYSFELRLRVSLSMDGDLSLVSRVRNVNGKPFSFSFAYHTHLSVSDIRYGIIWMVNHILFNWIPSYMLNFMWFFCPFFQLSYLSIHILGHWHQCFFSYGSKLEYFPTGKIELTSIRIFDVFLDYYILHQKA